MQHLSEMEQLQLQEHNKTRCSVERDVKPVLTLERRRVRSAPWGRRSLELVVQAMEGEHALVSQTASRPGKARVSHRSRGAAAFHTAQEQFSSEQR